MQLQFEAIVRQGANYIITLIVLNVSLLIKNHLSLHNIVKTPSAQNFMHTVKRHNHWGRATIGQYVGDVWPVTVLSQLAFT